MTRKEQLAARQVNRAAVLAMRPRFEAAQRGLGVVNNVELARRVGINPKLISSFLSLREVDSTAEIQRADEGLRKLGY